MAAPILSVKERGFLQSLLQHKVRFLVVGLSSAILQGAHTVTQDIDLWIEDLGSDAFLAAVKEAGGIYVPPGTVGLNPPLLAPGDLRMFDLVTHMHGLDEFSAEYSRAVEVEVSGLALKLLPLERIIVSKETAGRDKDKLALPALRAALALLQS